MTTPEQLAIGPNDVREAAARLAGVAHRTPVMTSRTLDVRVGGGEVFLKCENFQRGGAFKFRGAYNFLAQLPDESRRRGVIAYSSGNHAQGVALAAREFGVSATIVMPADAPAVKLAATRGYGARVVLYDRASEDREAVARRLAADHGLTAVPPFDHPWIIAGQGTAALELVSEVGQLDYFLAPLGGGGLLAGCATIVAALSPRTRIIGVETQPANDWELSLAAGKRIKIAPPDTIADGIRTEQPGALTFPIVRRFATVELVSDDEALGALRFLLMRLKILVEPTGAVALALVLSGRLGHLTGKRVGVILSGGNADPHLLARVLTAGDSD